MSKSEQFIENYEGIIRAALDMYSREMKEAAAEAQANYDMVAAEPEMRRKQDATWVTTNGLLNFAKIFTENSDKAGRALSALLDLDDEEEQEELAWR